MERIFEWMANIQMAVFLAAPLLLPLWLKRYVWLSFAAAGYILYVMWRIYLKVAGTAEDFGAEYGMFIMPYLAAISLIGYMLQKIADRRASNSSEK